MFTDVLIATNIIATSYTIYRIYLLEKRNKEKEIQRIMKDYITNGGRQLIKEIIGEYLHSNDFKQIVNDIINDSDLSKNVNRLILVLCAEIEEIKKTKICDFS